MDLTSTERYVVISTDGHCGADLMDYKPYLQKSLHEQFDEWAAHYSDAWGALDPEAGEGRVGAASFGSSYNWDSDKRLEHMETQGVAAEVLFPNTTPPFYPSGAITAPAPTNRQDFELRWAGVKAHNRWLADFCNAAPGRRAGLAQIFTNDIDEAIREARWARENGLMGVALPGDHVLQLNNLYYPRLDPFWEACVELDLPVHRHGVVPSEAAGPETGVGAPAVGIFECYHMAQRPVSHMVLGGVFERFPDLRFVVTEANAAWGASYATQLDNYANEALVPGALASMFAGDAVRALSLKPSEYVAKNVYFASFFTIDDIALRYDVGVSQMMWGADFPHHEGTSPHTRKALRVNFAGLPHDEVRMMLGGNAAKCYGLDMELLTDVAQEFGPAVEEVATPLPLDEYPTYPSETVCSTFAPQAWRRAATGGTANGIAST